MTHLVVVDGGGSGSRLAVYDSERNCLGTTISGPASLSLGVDIAWQSLRTGLDTLGGITGQAPGWWPARLSMGLAGALQQQRRDAFLALLPAGIEVSLVTDGRAQLFGATGGQPGICLALGTGTVVHWLDAKGHAGMAGGWGFPAGDEGSGAWLGLQYVNRLVWWRDRLASRHSAGDMLPPLFAVLEAHIGSSVSDIQLWSTCKVPAELATLVPLLHDHALQGDADAAALLDAGCAECLRLLELSPADLPVHVVGGLLPVYRTRLERVLGDRLRTPTGSAFDGLVMLADNAGLPG